MLNKDEVKSVFADAFKLVGDFANVPAMSDTERAQDYFCQLAEAGAALVKKHGYTCMAEKFFTMIYEVMESEAWYEAGRQKDG